MSTLLANVTLPNEKVSVTYLLVDLVYANITVVDAMLDRDEFADIERGVTLWEPL